jgi:hypothetical protein
MSVDREALLACMAQFTWLWSCEFFVETEHGNFIWKDPEYPNGDNTFTPFDGNLLAYLEKVGLDFGRDKGYHVVARYCGEEIKLNES